MNEDKQIDRRSLLKCSATGLAAASALLTGLAQQKSAGQARAAEADQRPAPSERVVIGLIGCGDLGRRYHLAHCLLPNPRIEIAAVCDVDRNHRDDAARMVFEKSGKRVGIYEDFRALVDRDDLDACVVVTPDHWHALASIAALEAGKDVYCEKPLSYSIAEGQAMVAATRRYGRVFQTGSQQRSDGRFRQACELVRNGKIGKVLRVDTVLHPVPSGSWEPARTPPPQMNWNFWLGPAPYCEYMPNCVHYQFRWRYEYSGGVMTDWGAHHNDIAQWALGMDQSGPVHVDGTQARFHEHGPYNVAGHFDVQYKYANGVELWCHSDDQTYPDGTKFGNGVKFTGDKGWLFVSRSDIQASDPEILKIPRESLPVKLYESNNHHENWLDCIRSRERCNCDVEVGHRSVTVCHIGNISMRLGRPLSWDPEKEVFVGDEAANQMLARPMRSPWHI